MTAGRRARTGEATPLVPLSIGLLAVAVALTGVAVALGERGNGGPSAVPRPAPAPPGATLRAEDFGARGDGVHDDGPALQRALDAMGPADALVLDGVYRHAQVLVVRRHASRLAGSGTLLATAEEASSLQVRADDVHIEGLVLRTATTTRRWSSPAQHRLYVGPHTGVVVTGVDVDGSAASGVFVDGARGFVLDDVSVTGSRADGIHMTGGAVDGVVRRPTVTRTGDDGIAVVSYDDDPAVTRRITVESPRVRTTLGGRGISVVGGEDVVYRDVYVRGSSAAAVYIGTEGTPFFTRSTRRVRVLGAELAGANTDPAVDHGAVLVVAGAPDAAVEDVRISDLLVSGTRRTASRQVGVLTYGAPVTDVELTDVRISGGGAAFSTNAPSDAVRTRGWELDGVPVRPSGSS